MFAASGRVVSGEMSFIVSYRFSDFIGTKNRHSRSPQQINKQTIQAALIQKAFIRLIKSLKLDLKLIPKHCWIDLLLEITCSVQVGRYDKLTLNRTFVVHSFHYFSLCNFQTLLIICGFKI